jgi:hypothetical protein
MPKCTICNQRGRCTCRRRINASVAARPADQPRPCTAMCGRTKGKACGATVRQGKCPCAYC